MARHPPAARSSARRASSVAKSVPGASAPESRVSGESPASSRETSTSPAMMTAPLISSGFAVRPALILLDMKMPVMDGWQFVRVLDGRGPRPPIVVLTAAPDPAARAAGVKAEGWLGKPFDYEDLETIVARLVR